MMSCVWEAAPHRGVTPVGKSALAITNSRTELDEFAGRLRNLQRSARQMHDDAFLNHRCYQLAFAVEKVADA
jgi:hypothetical protein